MEIDLDEKKKEAIIKLVNMQRQEDPQMMIPHLHYVLLLEAYKILEKQNKVLLDNSKIRMEP